MNGAAQPRTFDEEIFEADRPGLMFVRHWSACVIFPGGFGTLDEMFEIVTLMQTGKVRHHPLILVGRDEWEGLCTWLRDTVVAPGEFDLLQVCDDPEEIVKLVESAARREPPHDG